MIRVFAPALLGLAWCGVFIISLAISSRRSARVNPQTKALMDLDNRLLADSRPPDTADECPVQCRVLLWLVR